MEGLALVLPVLMTILFVTGSIHALPSEPLFLSQLTEREGELFLGDKDAEMGAHDTSYLVEKLHYHAESITTNAQQQIEDAQEFPPIDEDRHTRHKREVVVTDTILSELQSVFYELVQVNLTTTFPVAYPHDVETLYYNGELYVIAIAIADPSTTSEPDTIFIFKYNGETNSTDLVLTHTLQRIHDVDYFSDAGEYYVVATVWNDAFGNDGSIKVLQWNLGAPLESQTLTVIQNVMATYPVHIETFVAGGIQFIIASEHHHILLTEAAVMYEWKGGHMDEFAVFPKTNITSIVPIQIHSKVFIAIASKADADGNYATDSNILVFNIHIRQFEVFQAIRTFAAIDMASFLLGSGLETEAFLLIANAHSEKGGSPRSIIYKYNEDRFEPFQCLEVSDIFGWHLIKDGSHLASLIIYTADAVRFYEYDGWVFAETAVQFNPPDIVSLPVSAMSSHFRIATHTADLVVASNQPAANQALTLFRIKLIPTSLADRFNDEAVAVCAVEEVTLQTISTKYINVTQRVDEVVYKDIGTFVYNGNVTFLGNVTAGDSVIKQVMVLDGPILTKEEEAQLEELREMVANSTSYLQMLLGLLPNTMLVNTTAQTIPGSKTFSSITAEGDLTSDTLTVTSNTVNGDIDLQEISDTYIDTTQPQVLNITMTVAGGVDVAGDLDVTGLVDGVDMDDVVTLSGDHTITGAKTFTATLTAQQDLDVTGTVDGITLTSAAVLMTSGAQTVAGALTFDGGLTANEDVTVTGVVDTVDLSELADSAFYLDGNNIVTGTLNFTGLVTMDGLNTANGSTVDGLDFDDIVNILRMSVEQNITAYYVFTNALVIYANITVGGLVNGLNIPTDVVLIDDPNPVIVEGPIIFDADMNISCLAIKDTLNDINVPNEYISLNLFLTAPRNDKMMQRLQGEVDFEIDITILGNSSVSGRVDGVDLDDMADDTVYITGDQQITGLKTFSGDMKIGSNLTVAMLINGVDINDLDDNTVKLSEGVINTLGTVDFNGDVQFEAAVTTNGSHTFGDTLTLSDLVTQHTDETVGGAKTFTQSVTSGGDVSVTSTINTVTVDTLYSDAVRLDALSSVTVTATWDFSNDVGVGGDLSVTGNIDGIDLDDAVTIQGAQTITSPTAFLGTLTSTVNISITGDLTLSDINGYDVTDVDTDTLKCSGAQTVTGRKTFDALTVDDNIIITGTVDGVDISDIYANAVFVSGDQSISGIKTFNSEASFENMVFNGLVNGISIPEFFSTVLTQGTVQTVQGAVTTSDILVKADVTVNDTVNGLVIEDLWDHSAKTTDSTYAVQIQFAEVESGDDVQASGTVDGIVISRDVATADATGQAFTGKKTFLSPTLFEEDIAVVNVNDVDILDLWTRTVKNTGDQVISASKTFNAGITVNGDISVTGTVDGVDVSDLASRAVLTSSSDPSAVQTITADVTFTDVRALQDINYSGLLQTVNIQSLDSSYVSRSASSQTIVADKTFSDSVTMVTGGSLDVDSLDLDGTLNGHDMDTLYDTAWINGGSTTVYNTKTFDQCVTMEDDLTVDGTVDGVDISGNVMTTDLNQQVTGFKIFTEDLTIDENLKFQTGNQIDGVDVSDWGSNAARMDSSYTVTPDMTFQNIDFEESVSVTGTVNGLNFSPATFMTKSRDQDVTAVKTFQYGVQFTGNMDVTGTVQGADVVEIDTNSLITSGAQTLQGSLVFEGGPTFSDITTTALIDGQDVVELYMRVNNLPDLEGFDDFMEDHCNLLDDMHDAFENQAYILRYPELVQTIRTNGRAKWRAHYYNGTQWLMQARTKVHIDNPDEICINSFIYQWSDAEEKYNVFKTLTLDFAEDAVFFEEEGYLFLAIITSNISKECEVINLLPSDAQPSRNPDFQHNAVSPNIFHDIADFIVHVYVWSPDLEDFLVYQSLTGVGSVSVDYYVDPLLNESCLALANHRAFNDAGNMTTNVMSAVYCMESVASGFTHSAVIDTLGAVKILPFVYDNILHLVVANRLDTAQRTFMVESTIFGNFIQEVAIPTSAVSDVAVHSFHGNYFVAFANEFEGQLEWEDYDVPISIYTYTYDPEGASSVSLVQEIPAYRVQSLEFFEVYDQLFLVVVNRTSSVTIFRYKGLELFKVVHTIPLVGAANLEVFPFKNDPKNLHIAATAYMERASVVPGAPIRTKTVDSFILSLYFQGFDTDTIGCTSP